MSLQKRRLTVSPSQLKELQDLLSIDTTGSLEEQPAETKNGQVNAEETSHGDPLLSSPQHPDMPSKSNSDVLFDESEQLTSNEASGPGIAIQPLEFDDTFGSPIEKDQNLYTSTFDENAVEVTRSFGIIDFGTTETAEHRSPGEENPTITMETVHHDKSSRRRSVVSPSIALLFANLDESSDKDNNSGRATGAASNEDLDTPTIESFHSPEPVSTTSRRESIISPSMAALFNFGREEGTVEPSTPDVDESPTFQRQFNGAETPMAQIRKQDINSNANESALRSVPGHRIRTPHKSCLTDAKSRHNQERKTVIFGTPETAEFMEDAAVNRSITSVNKTETKLRFGKKDDTKLPFPKLDEMDNDLNSSDEREMDDLETSYNTSILLEWESEETPHASSKKELRSRRRSIISKLKNQDGTDVSSPSDSDNEAGVAATSELTTSLSMDVDSVDVAPIPPEEVQEYTDGVALSIAEDPAESRTHVMTADAPVHSAASVVEPERLSETNGEDPNKTVLEEMDHATNSMDQSPPLPISHRRQSMIHGISRERRRNSGIFQKRRMTLAVVPGVGFVASNHLPTARFSNQPEMEQQKNMASPAQRSKETLVTPAELPAPSTTSEPAKISDITHAQNMHFETSTEISNSASFFSLPQNDFDNNSDRTADFRNNSLLLGTSVMDNTASTIDRNMLLAVLDGKEVVLSDETGSNDTSIDAQAPFPELGPSEVQESDSLSNPEVESPVAEDSLPTQQAVQPPPETIDLRARIEKAMQEAFHIKVATREETPFQVGKLAETDGSLVVHGHQLPMGKGIEQELPGNSAVPAALDSAISPVNRDKSDDEENDDMDITTKFSIETLERAGVYKTASLSVRASDTASEFPENVYLPTFEDTMSMANMSIASNIEKVPEWKKQITTEISNRPEPITQSAILPEEETGRSGIPSAQAESYEGHPVVSSQREIVVEQVKDADDNSSDMSMISLLVDNGELAVENLHDPTCTLPASLQDILQSELDSSRRSTGLVTPKEGEKVMAFEERGEKIEAATEMTPWRVADVPRHLDAMVQTIPMDNPLVGDMSQATFAPIPYTRISQPFYARTEAFLPSYAPNTPNPYYNSQETNVSTMAFVSSPVDLQDPQLDPLSLSPELRTFARKIDPVTRKEVYLSIAPDGNVVEHSQHWQSKFVNTKLPGRAYRYETEMEASTYMQHTIHFSRKRALSPQTPLTSAVQVPSTKRLQQFQPETSTPSPTSLLPRPVGVQRFVLEDSVIARHTPTPSTVPVAIHSPSLHSSHSSHFIPIVPPTSSAPSELQTDARAPLGQEFAIVACSQNSVYSARSLQHTSPATATSSIQSPVQNLDAALSEVQSPLGSVTTSISSQTNVPVAEVENESQLEIIKEFESDPILSKLSAEDLKDPNVSTQLMIIQSQEAEIRRMEENIRQMQQKLDQERMEQERRELIVSKAPQALASIRSISQDVAFQFDSLCTTTGWYIVLHEPTTAQLEAFILDSSNPSLVVTSLNLSRNNPDGSVHQVHLDVLNSGDIFVASTSTVQDTREVNNKHWMHGNLHQFYYEKARSVLEGSIDIPHINQLNTSSRLRTLCTSILIATEALQNLELFCDEVQLSQQRVASVLSRSNTGTWTLVIGLHARALRHLMGTEMRSRCKLVFHLESVLDYPRIVPKVTIEKLTNVSSGVMELLTLRLRESAELYQLQRATSGAGYGLHRKNVGPLLSLINKAYTTLSSV